MGSTGVALYSLRWKPRFRGDCSAPLISTKRTNMSQSLADLNEIERREYT